MPNAKEYPTGDGRKVVVREAAAQDISSLVSLFNAVGAEGRFILTESVTDRQREYMKETIATKSGRTLSEVAEVSGSLVGHLSLIPRGRDQIKKCEHVVELGMHILKDLVPTGSESHRARYL